MTPEEIEKNKAAYLEQCRRHISREGLEALLKYLEEKTDFFRAPSSTAFHLNEEGGLCKHSLNVFEAAAAMYEHVLRQRMQEGTATFSGEIPMESIAITTLFHDLCKTNLYHPSERFKKDESGRWVTYAGYEIKDDFPFGHGEKSCFILERFMRLKPSELLAIRWHMGMFDMGEQGSVQRYAFRAALERTPLVCLVHAADFIASNCLETTIVH